MWRAAVGFSGYRQPRHTCSSLLSVAGSSSLAAAWPTEFRSRSMDFCSSEVRSWSVASAWPRSGRAQWVLLARGRVNVGGFSSVFGVPWSYRFEAGCFFVLQVPFFFLEGAAPV